MNKLSPEKFSRFWGKTYIIAATYLHVVESEGSIGGLNFGCLNKAFVDQEGNAFRRMAIYVDFRIENGHA